MEMESKNAEEVSGWADSMARILGSSKPRNKKVLILSRAKKDYEVVLNKPKVTKKPKPNDDLEIVKDNDNEPETEPPKEIIEEDIKPLSNENSLSLKTQRKLELKQKRLEKLWENHSRRKANEMDVQVERALAKIATKGVVQLFNAVGMQQKTVRKKLGTVRNSEFKKDKVLSQSKDIFEVAMKKSLKLDGNSADQIEIKDEMEDDDLISKSKNKYNSNRNSKDSVKKPAFQALQDDFMLDGKMKDWDRSSDSDT